MRHQLPHQAGLLAIKPRLIIAGVEPCFAPALLGIKIHPGRAYQTCAKGKEDGGSPAAGVPLVIGDFSVMARFSPDDQRYEGERDSVGNCQMFRHGELAERHGLP